MIRIHVVNGGSSSEREVSLRSGVAVANALSAHKNYAVYLQDLRDTSIENIAACDVVFPVLHGVGGEDGELQAKLEVAGVKFVGSDSRASALCFDKWEYRKVVTQSGLPMPKAATLEHHSHHAGHELAQDLHVLKPINGGSSIDTFIVRDLATIPHGEIKESFSRYRAMLIEELIEGTELTVGVLGEEALPIIEIIPPEGSEFNYDNKYNGATQEIVAPDHISLDVQKAAQELALKAHQLTGCRDFSRTDIMCDRANNLFLLETNTIPGMTGQSLFPKMALKAGLDMTSLCSKLVEMALSR